ncbi:MAG: 50S ribosomal protein L21 [Bacteroidota bacterium]
MYAIVEIGGHQYKVEKDQQLYVNRLSGEKGDKVQFDNVLLIDNGGKVNVGAPVIDGAAVEAKIVDHLRADKVIVFKKKRRKGYKKKNGHRQDITSVEISKIIEKGAKASGSSKAKAAPKKAEAKADTTAKVEAPKKEAPKAAKGGKDDLKKIEGIGPKCAEHLNNGGINTFADLADAKIERLQEILDAAGPRYKIINPSTWAEQAVLARDGKWDELKKLQDELDGGVRD